MSQIILFVLLFTVSYGLFQLYDAHMKYIHDQHVGEELIAFWSSFLILSVIICFSFVATWRWVWS